ncbi:hypothetical protein [Streptomyces achromogenes]|uniref:hypothetical protein n=1 Tax=Streptomyces achromogenes TaxID=67255 RepID=UPI00358FFE83
MSSANTVGDEVMRRTASGGREGGGDLPAAVGAWPGAQFAAERGDAFGEADQAEAAAAGRRRQR